MKGRFAFTGFSFIFGAFMLLCGSYTAVKLALLGVQEIKAGGTLASIFFCFNAAIICAAFGCGALFLCRFNKGAYLSIERSKIDAQYSFGTKISFDISEISCVYVYGNSLIIKTVYNKAHTVLLLNASEIYKYIRHWQKYFNKQDKKTDVGATGIFLSALKPKYRLYLALTIFFCLMMFVNVFITVALTSGRELSEFDDRQSIIFIIFTLTEAVTATFSFIFASKAGRLGAAKNEAIRELAVEEAERNKNNIAHIGSVGVNPLEIICYNEYLNRIIIYKTVNNAGEAYFFTHEAYSVKDFLWQPGINITQRYATLEALREDIDRLMEYEYIEEIISL